MVIKTITCHDVYNFGASLQAYALEKYLLSLGHEASIIDYKPNAVSYFKAFFSVSNPKYRHFPLNIAYIAAKIPQKRAEIRRRRAFDRFTGERLILTPRYTTHEQLLADPPQADVYFAGSDQIWNPLFPTGHDGSFFLDFAPKGKIRASYAASFAVQEIPQDCVSEMSGRIKGLDAVSVRENNGVALARLLGVREPVAVVDPVFLHDAAFWKELSVCSALEIPENEKYVLVYDFDGNTDIRAMALRLKKERGMKIYSFFRHNIDYADAYFYDISPEDFLRLIEKSAFVLSNSFHASAFSIIFGKEFYAFSRNISINSRMSELLGSLGLPERMIVPEKLPEKITDTDMTLCREKLEAAVAESKKYIHRVLEAAEKGLSGEAGDAGTPIEAGEDEMPHETGKTGIPLEAGDAGIPLEAGDAGTPLEAGTIVKSYSSSNAGDRMKRKKLLFMIDSLGAGGAEKSLLSLICLLCECGEYDIDILVTKAGGAFERFLPESVGRLPEPEFSVFMRSSAVKQLLSNKPAMLSARIRYSAALRNNGKKLHTAQLLWQCSSCVFNRLPGHYDIAVAYQQGLPTYYVAEKVDADRKIAWVNTDYSAAGYDAQTDRAEYEIFDAIVGVSQQSCRVLRECFPDMADKITEITDILNPSVVFSMAQESASGVEKTGSLSLLTVGRLVEAKGYDIAVSAAEILKNRGVDFKWYVVGDGAEREKIKSSVAKAGLEERFILIGLLPNPYPWFKTADIYVQTSRFEGYGIALAESRLFGVPAVSTCFPAVEKQLRNGENGIITQMTGEAVAEGIMKLSEDAALYRRIKAALEDEEKGNVSELKKVIALFEGEPLIIHE